VLARSPPARIDELLTRVERIIAKRGEVPIRGEEDFYYVIESAAARSTAVGGVHVALAELKAGDAFGEEALASDARRNGHGMAGDGSAAPGQAGRRTAAERVGYAEA
jgi:CRP-like cAMP-binding protein